MDNEEKSKIELAAETIRKMSKDAKLTRYEDFYAEPLSMTQEEVDGIVGQFKESEDYADIKTILGKSGIYLYTENRMTFNYAKMLVRIEDKDLVKMVADTVREDSKIYPRPTEAKFFSNSPFNLSQKELASVLEQLKNRQEYSDIKEAKASNGAVYLYSTQYFTRDHAEYLTEWIEVGQSNNP